MAKIFTKTGVITVKEIKTALLTIIKFISKEHFSGNCFKLL